MNKIKSPVLLRLYAKSKESEGAYKEAESAYQKVREILSFTPKREGESIHSNFSLISDFLSFFFFFLYHFFTHSST